MPAHSSPPTPDVWGEPPCWETPLSRLTLLLLGELRRSRSRAASASSLDTGWLSCPGTAAVLCARLLARRAYTHNEHEESGSGVHRFLGAGRYYFAGFSNVTAVGLRAFSLSSSDWSFGRDGGMVGAWSRSHSTDIAGKRD